MNQASAASPIPAGIALSATGLCKTFFATKALVDVDLELRPAEIHGLVGENGSGKSTLVKILAGVYSADRGEVAGPHGEIPAASLTPSLSRALGIRVVHQDFPVFGTMSVAENLFLGRTFPSRFGRVDTRRMNAEAREALDRFNVPARPEQSCDELDPAVRAMLAIARALQDCDGADAGLLILDEPTAALTQTEVETLLAAVRRYAADGWSIALVSHRLDEILDTCDRVTILRDGRRIAVKARDELNRRTLVEAIIGRSLAAHHGEPLPDASAPTSAGSPVLAMHQVCTATSENLDLTVHEGEVVGVAGLIGSGRTELLETVFGTRPRSSGEVEIAGARLGGLGPAEAMAHGVAMIAEDRGRDSAFGLLTVRENLSVSVLPEFWTGGRISRRRENLATRELVERFDIQPPDPAALMSNLSGGNQQKVVLARWMRRDPKLLLLDEPTQGVDVGARQQVHDMIRAAAHGGTGVLLVSSDMEELVELSDRIVVMVAGQLIHSLTGDRIDRVRLSHLVHGDEPNAATEEEAK